MMQLAYLIFDGLEALLKPASPPPFSVPTNEQELAELNRTRTGERFAKAKLPDGTFATSCIHQMSNAQANTHIQRMGS